MRLNVSSNATDVAGRIRALGNSGKTAAARALTATAKQDVQPAIKQEIHRAFDRPTEYTLNSTFLKAASRDTLEARVWLKDNPSGKGTPADRYLAPDIFGGDRRQKGMEKALQAARLMPPGYVAVPAAGVQLDANGNVKRSQIVQILSQLRAQLGSGFESRSSGSARSRRTVARQGVTYFALPRPSKGLSAGVYIKRKFAHGSAVRPVFLFVPRATYQKILKFFEVGEQAARSNFPRRFDAETARAIEAARLR
jgi:hypothetical protein